MQEKQTLQNFDNFLGAHELNELWYLRLLSEMPLSMANWFFFFPSSHGIKTLKCKWNYIITRKLAWNFFTGQMVEPQVFFDRMTTG